VQAERSTPGKAAADRVTFGSDAEARKSVAKDAMRMMAWDIEPSPGYPYVGRTEEQEEEARGRARARRTPNARR
jgi:hypothetical protein